MEKQEEEKNESRRQTAVNMVVSVCVRTHTVYAFGCIRLIPVYKYAFYTLYYISEELYL